MSQRGASIDKLVLFWDGCHKIYYCQSDDEQTIDKMNSYGYKP